MRNSERIHTVEEIILRQRYLTGCQFKVKIVSDDKFLVEFVSMTQVQLNILRARLQEYQLHHIQPVALTLVEGTDPLKEPLKKRKRKRRR